jgi:hypothetical protein
MSATTEQSSLQQKERVNSVQIFIQSTFLKYISFFVSLTVLEKGYKGFAYLSAAQLL